MKGYFKKIREQVKEEEEKYFENTKNYILESDSALERNSTGTRWNQYQNGTIDRETAVNYALARKEVAKQRKIEKKNNKLDEYAGASDVESVDIFVEWKRNRTWGYNPTARVNVHTNNGTFTATGTASGCGYDKESTAVGSALNDIPAIKKMLCECKENAMKTGKKSENPLEVNSNSNSALIAYGAGYGAIPYFEGGVGMSSFVGVFNACGFVLKHSHETDKTCYYHFVKKSQDV